MIRSISAYPRKGRAQFCQGWGRGFESLRPLQFLPVKSCAYAILDRTALAYSASCALLCQRIVSHLLHSAALLARAASLDPQQALTFSENASLEPDGFREPNPLGFWNKRYISLAGSIFQKGVANVRPAPFVSPQGNTRTPLFRRDVIRKPETSPIPAPTATSYQ